MPEGVVEMTKKEMLTRFGDEALDIIEELILTTSEKDLFVMINEIKQERAQAKNVSWNARYRVEDMVLDWDVLKTLKRNHINTLQELMDIDISKIPGITQSGIEQLEWAILFFDMTSLQKLHETNPNATQMDAAKLIVKQGKEVEKVLAKRHGKK